MRAFSVSELRENMAAALDGAETELVVIRRNGREYEVRLRPPANGSGLAVPGIETARPACLCHPVHRFSSLVRSMEAISC